MRRDRKIVVGLLACLCSTFLYASDALQDEMILELLKTSKASEAQIQELRMRLFDAEVKVDELEKKVESLENPPINLLAKPAPVEGGTISEKVEQDIKSSVQKQKNENNDYIVEVWSLNVRKKPTKSSKKLGWIHIGDVINIKNIINGWGEVEQGFVNTHYLDRIDYNNSDTYAEAVVSVEYAKVRELPSKRDKIIKREKKQKIVKVFNKIFNKNWYKLKDEKGFIHKSDIVVVIR